MRPWKHRIWFTKPQWHWFGIRTLVPFHKGGDEFDWHCWEFGWTITGRVTVAIRPCPRTGKCEEDMRDEPVVAWPVDAYGHNHIDPNCDCDGCLDRLGQ